MKKILLAFVACAGLLTSCDMDTIQEGVIKDDEPLTYDFLTQYRNYAAYSALRGRTVGSWVYDTELQLDQFIGLNTNGGRGMNIANGFINASNGSASSTYSSLYAGIAQCNLFLERANEALDRNDLSEEEVVEVNRYIAEVKFSRAWCYFYLFDHFCQTYDESKGETEALGLCLVTKYAPSHDPSTYPGRSTMNATLKLINDDLDDAFDVLSNYEETAVANVVQTMVSAGANYLSSYAVAALQARIALVTGKYDTAISKAQYVISNGNYQLATLQNYLKLWADQDFSELIFTPYVDAKEISNQQAFSTCQGWNYWWAQKDQSDYIPTEETVYSLAQYRDAEGYINDVRFVAFIEERPVVVEGGKATTYVFVKYPGNTALDTTTPMYDNIPKPFRLSEQYLIIAEAAAMSNNVGLANEALSELVRARLVDDSNFVDFSYSGNGLIAAVRAERSRELLGEGFRLSDLRRWKQGFDRNQPYELNEDVAMNRAIQCLNVRYSDDDYRFVWPIPQSEMEINPQLKGQQNPGY